MSLIHRFATSPWIWIIALFAAMLATWIWFIPFAVRNQPESIPLETPKEQVEEP